MNDKLNYNILLTCEHASNKIPAKYVSRFSKWSLATHKGYDLGALELAKFLQKKLHVKLIQGEVSRLLVDLNRSEKNPQCVNCHIISEKECKQIVSKYYEPYRQKVMQVLKRLHSNKAPTLHLSIHSFTRSLRGKKRSTEVGILFDPNRKSELAFAKVLLKEFEARKIRTKFNYPYKGTMDGFTVALRKLFKDKTYLGIELEVCSDQFRKSKALRTHKIVAEAVQAAIKKR